jgi:hypothetical protein
MQDDQYRQLLLQNLRQQRREIINDSVHKDWPGGDYSEVKRVTNPLWQLTASQSPDLVSASFSLTTDKRGDPLERYRSSQSKRVNQLREFIETGRESHNKSQNRELWSEVKVENEIMLLRKARQMTKQSYQNRIKTGGSLVRCSKASTGLDSGEDSELKPIVRGVLTDSSLGHEDPNITRHFRSNLIKKPNPFTRSSFNAPPLS